MKKKIIISISLVAFLLIVAGIAIWKITKGGTSYPDYLKEGRFFSVNDKEKCYIYDAETSSFTGEYFIIKLKADGFTDKGSKKVEDGNSSLVFNDEEVLSDEMFVMFETGEGYGKILYIANNTEIDNTGTSVNINKTRTEYEFYYSVDFSELQYVWIYEDDKEPIVGYVGDSIEEAEEMLKNLK